MGSRIQPETWHAIIQIVAFALIFLAFVYFSIRALTMKRDHIKHMASLPLRDNEEETTTEDPSLPPKKKTDTD